MLLLFILFGKIDRNSLSFKLKNKEISIGFCHLFTVISSSFFFNFLLRQFYPFNLLSFIGNNIETLLLIYTFHPQVIIQKRQPVSLNDVFSKLNPRLGKKFLPKKTLADLEAYHTFAYDIKTQLLNDFWKNKTPRPLFFPNVVLRWRKRLVSAWNRSRVTLGVPTAEASPSRSTRAKSRSSRVPRTIENPGRSSTRSRNTRTEC